MQNASNNPIPSTDYSNFTPLGKSSVNTNDFAAQGDPRKAAKQNNAPKYQAKKGKFSQVGQKQTGLQSSLDGHHHAPLYKATEVEAPARAAIVGKNANQKTKLAFLSSNAPIGTSDPNQFYSHTAKGEVIDFDISGIPSTADEITVKRAAKVKHVISTELQTDNLKGICTGNGRIKVRLNEGETTEMVKRNLA